MTEKQTESRQRSDNSANAIRTGLPSNNSTTDLSPPPIDIQTALSNLGGDADLLKEVVEVFLDTIPRQLAELSEASANADLDRLRAAAHSLKGSTSNICAESARSLSAQLEVLCDQGSGDRATAILPELEKELERLRVFASGPFLQKA